METLHLTQKVRPLRLLLSVSEDSEDQALFAFQLNCALWGGMLNPVVSNEQGEEFLKSIFEASRADFGINLSDEPWPASMVSKYEGRLKSVKGYDGLIEQEKERYYFRLGCDMVPLFADHWEKHGKYRALSTEANEDFLILDGTNDYWRKYVSITAGTYPSGFKHNYAARYAKATACKQISLGEGILDSFTRLLQHFDL